MLCFLLNKQLNVFLNKKKVHSFIKRGETVEHKHSASSIQKQRDNNPIFFNIYFEKIFHNLFLQKQKPSFSVSIVAR